CSVLRPVLAADLLVVCLVIRRSLPHARGATLFPYTTLFRSCASWLCAPTAVALTSSRAFVLIVPPVTASCRPTSTGSGSPVIIRSEEHTSELQSRCDLVCRLLLETKKIATNECKRPTRDDTT